MIPFLLAIAGGYLIGDSMKDSQTFAEGGTLDEKYENYEIVVVCKYAEKDGGGFRHRRYLVSAKNLYEAKVIAAGMFEEDYKYADFYLFEVLSDSEHRLKYMAEGGMMADGGSLIGKRVRLIEMKEDTDPIAPGTIGTIVHTGGDVINVQWDNGRRLGLVEGIDEYEFIDEFARGGKMAKGGSLNTYKLRAEGLNDFLSFLQEGMYMRMKSFTIEPIGVPDVVVSFVTDASLSEIKSTLKKIPDSNVMLQTIKPINEYTGERMADGGMMADGGKMAKGGSLNNSIRSYKKSKIGYEA